VRGRKPRTDSPRPAAGEGIGAMIGSA